MRGMQSKMIKFLNQKRRRQKLSFKYVRHYGSFAKALNWILSDGLNFRIHKASSVTVASEYCEADGDIDCMFIYLFSAIKTGESQQKLPL